MQLKAEVGSDPSERFALTVALGRHVDLTCAEDRIHHAFGAGDRLMEPRRPLVELDLILRLLFGRKSRSSYTQHLLLY